MKRKAKRFLKTVSDYLNELPSPYKERAILNLLPSESSKQVKSALSALQSAFVWNETPEGGDYWNEFSKTL